MTHHIHAIGAVVTGVLVSGTALVRWAVKPPVDGQQRVSAVLTDESLADQLLGPWPERPHGAVAATAWRQCRTCGHMSAGVVHTDGTWTCGEYGNHAGVA